MCFMERAISTTAAVEEWRPIAGYEGLYEVSSLGRVRSLPRDTYCVTKKKRPYLLHVRGRILSFRYTKGYAFAHLCDKDHHPRHFAVHRLVAAAFIPNPLHLPEVNHKDEHPSNNHVSNLEWCDRLYNVRYGTRLLRCKLPCTTRSIEQLTLDGKHVAYYRSIRSACKEFGCDRRSVQRAIRGDGRVTVSGYRWRYVN